MYKQKAAYNDGMASRYKAAQTRLRKFEQAGPPVAQPREQQVSMRLKGGRTGKRAVVCERLELSGSMHGSTSRSGTASGWQCSVPTGPGSRTSSGCSQPAAATPTWSIVRCRTPR